MGRKLAVPALQRRTGVGLSEAVNILIRQGANLPRIDYTFPDVEFAMGARVPIDKTSDVLELLNESGG